MLKWSNEDRLISEIREWSKNPRIIGGKKFEDLITSMDRFGYVDQIVINTDGELIGGHARLQKLKQDGETSVSVRTPDRKLNEAEFNELAIRLNKNIAGEWDFDALLKDFDSGDLTEWGFEKFDFPEITVGGEDNYSDGKKGALSENWGIPPFSVLSARDGGWQERKRAWIAKGIESHEGRADNLISYSKISTMGEKDTSIFDPVLCELLVNWFSPKEGVVLDPFAGGSVRGIISAILGRNYIGIDIRKEQVEANRNQAEKVCEFIVPTWKTGTSAKIDDLCKGVEADFILSCPPYAYLEKYSDDPDDISNMNYEDFIETYKDIIKKTCRLLKNDSFACFVVGEIRDKKGNYHNFVGDTIKAFIDSGLNFYNEAILVTAIGSLPLRAGKAMKTSRKLGKTHQNILVFVKGDGKKAASKISNEFVDYCMDSIEKEGQQESDHN